MPNLEPLQSIEQLSPRVIRVLGQNPGAFTLQGTNTYLIGTGENKILIDTGEPFIKAYLLLLKEALKDSKIVGIICTHWHHDHTGGCEGIFETVTGGNVPVYKLRCPHNMNNQQYFEYVEDGREVAVEGATLRFVASPGHTDDHASVWLEEEQTLFSGDCILGSGTTIFDDLYSYMHSLQKIKSLNPTKIYPGHGPVVDDPIAKIEEYINHRMAREHEIVKFFEEVKEATTVEVVNRVYKDYPFAVRIGALGNVNQHCWKLVKDGRLEEVSKERYKIVGNPLKL